MKPDDVFWDRMQSRAKETIEAFKVNRQPHIIRFAVHITNNCNMNCEFCNDHKGGQTMSREMFSSICHKAGKEGIVHITGGEPMTVPWLEDEIENLHTVTRFALNTNLLILPKPATMKHVFRIKSSLDNYEASGKREHWGKQIIDHIRLASESTEYCSVSFTATHQTALRFRPFIQFCRQQFPRLYSVSASFYKGDNANLKLTQEDVDILFDAAYELDDISRQIFIDTHTMQGNYFPNNLIVPCYLSLTERLYDEKGDEYFCSHLYRDHVKAPGNPGKDPHCVTGCNARFYKYNKEIHETLSTLSLI